MSELNDAQSKIPAYQRFEDTDSCVLRDDLRKLKEEHFRRNYEKELKNPMDIYDKVSSSNLKADATNYFTLKYFVSKEQKN